VKECECTFGIDDVCMSTVVSTVVSDDPCVPVKGGMNAGVGDDVAAAGVVW
jgi:hypothetical protein